MSTISLQNSSTNNKNKLTSKGEDSGSVLQPVLVPQLGYSTIQNILEINKKLIKVLIEYQNYGWIEDPDFIIYQRRLQTNLNYLATVADNYLNFDKLNIPDLSPVNIADKLKKKLEEKENEQKNTNINNANNTNNVNNIINNTNVINTTNNNINTMNYNSKNHKYESSEISKKIIKKDKEEIIKLEEIEDLESDDSSSYEIIQSLPPPYFISDPNIYDQTELDNVSPIDPGSYVATQPFVIPEYIKRPPAVDKSKDVGYLTPGVTRAIFKGRWEGITLGGNNNNNNNNNN